MVLPGVETGEEEMTGGQLLGHSLPEHGTDSRDATQVFRAEEDSRVPMGRDHLSNVCSALFLVTYPGHKFM